MEAIFMKTILLTGGGTAGHVTPNLALIPSLKAAGYDIRYIGSYSLRRNLFRKTAPIFRFKELYRPIPRIKRLRRGLKVDEKIQTGCSLL